LIRAILAEKAEAETTHVETVGLAFLSKMVSAEDALLGAVPPPPPMGVPWAVVVAAGAMRECSRPN
jgi:hypothetical protein